MANSLSAGALLKKVSRSFALVIPMLDKNKRKEVENCYLLARLIDTIEDSEHSKADKTELMNYFLGLFKSLDTDGMEEALNRLRERTINGHDKLLLDNFNDVFDFYKRLDDGARGLALDCLSEMGKGMLMYEDKEIISSEDLDDYCYYVAGTVGIYLTKLVKLRDGIELDTAKGLADARLLQKVNITRDFRMDYHEGRVFWPKAFFSSVGSSVKEVVNGTCPYPKRMDILAQMIYECEKELSAAFEYMNDIPKQINGYRRFCLIPALMAVGTLEAMRNNDDVMSSDKPVKIPRGEVHMILLKERLGFYSGPRIKRRLIDHYRQSE